MRTWRERGLGARARRQGLSEGVFFCFLRGPRARPVLTLKVKQTCKTIQNNRKINIGFEKTIEKIKNNSDLFLQMLGDLVIDIFKEREKKNKKKKRPVLANAGGSGHRHLQRARQRAAIFSPQPSLAPAQPPKKKGGKGV